MLRPPPGRIVGLDIGQKRTGVAVSDDTQLIASPRSTITTESKKEWLAQVVKILEEETATSVLVGIPLNHHGERGSDAENIGRFIALLRERVSLPVLEWDERFTTVQAERALLEADVSRGKRKLVIDKVAASLTLQNFLDSLRFDPNRYE